MKRKRLLAAVVILAPVVIATAQFRGWQARPEAVAQAVTQQPGFNYDESQVGPYTLPDPLAHNGKKVTSALNWPARRAEILDLWADPRGEFLSLAATSPVFAFWGDAPIRDGDMPAVDAPLIVGRRGYHIRTGGHNLTPYDWDRYADFADRVWKRSPVK